MHLDSISLLLSTICNTEYNLLPFRDRFLISFQMNSPTAQIRSQSYFRQILWKKFILNFGTITQLDDSNVFILNDQWNLIYLGMFMLGTDFIISAC